ncbi:hypothetical protein [Psychromonas antarctica]|uniref:hypothetical protein n=1 Tax=Psychromonas antarctica TaxID=67573 RepID=UPI001EE8D4B6|nr:hypothetical protein [Psychromonas antarctica]MCG6200012.1 hypothetical protein [Psychromonas antarctica]
MTGMKVSGSNPDITEEHFLNDVWHHAIVTIALVAYDIYPRDTYLVIKMADGFLSLFAS